MSGQLGPDGEGFDFPEDAADFLEGDDGEPHGDPDPEGDARIGLVAMENGWGTEAAQS